MEDMNDKSSIIIRNHDRLNCMQVWDIPMKSCPRSASWVLIMRENAMEISNTWTSVSWATFNNPSITLTTTNAEPKQTSNKVSNNTYPKACLEGLHVKQEQLLLSRQCRHSFQEIIEKVWCWGHCVGGIRYSRAEAATPKQLHCGSVRKLRSS